MCYPRHTHTYETDQHNLCNKQAWPAAITCRLVKPSEILKLEVVVVVVVLGRHCYTNKPNLFITQEHKKILIVNIV